MTFTYDQLIDNAIEYLQLFEPEEGYKLAFSGGKDSQTIYHLAEQAGVKFRAEYNNTTVDPPELVKFIRTNYPKVKINNPNTSMWKLIIKNGVPPMRIRRYCCKELKERNEKNVFVVTGIRRAESSNRANRPLVSSIKGKQYEVIIQNDNDINRRTFETCQLKCVRRTFLIFCQIMK